MAESRRVDGPSPPAPARIPSPGCGVSGVKRRQNEAPSCQPRECRFRPLISLELPLVCPKTLCRLLCTSSFKTSHNREHTDSNRRRGGKREGKLQKSLVLTKVACFQRFN